MIAVAFVPAAPGALDPVDLLLTVPGALRRFDIAAAIRASSTDLHDQEAASQAATTLRSLANDLDALAHTWRLEARAADPWSPTL